MKYVYIVSIALSFVCGAVISHRIYPRTVVREIPTVVTKTQTVTKEVVKQADGTVIERVVTQTKDKVKTSPQPLKPEYRVGVLLPVASELRLPTVTASRRLFGDVWLDAQFNTRNREALVGVSVEF